MDTSHTLTITLPLTPYQPEELLIISTVEPSDGDPIMANFSRPGMQYSVTSDNLMADTPYTFTVRIVLRANTTVDVVPAVMGSFTTFMTPSKWNLLQHKSVSLVPSASHYSSMGGSWLLRAHSHSHLDPYSGTFHVNSTQKNERPLRFQRNLVYTYFTISYITTPNFSPICRMAS